MVDHVINQQIQAAQTALRPFLELVTQSPTQRAPVIADFLSGNPQEPTLPGFVEALQRWSVPASTDWFAYRMMHEPAREAGHRLSFGAAQDAVMQYALPDIDRLLIDVTAVERRRDRMVAALREQGYELLVPEGTFSLLPRAPVADDRAFCALLDSQGVLVLPEHVVELPGYFRISLTATDEMVERSLPVFAHAIERAARHTGHDSTTHRAREHDTPGTGARHAGR